MLEPQSFSRPVTVDGIEQLARFRTVRTAPDLFAAGRVYYCQHYTPELVWHPSWMSHTNGCLGLSELVVVTTTIEADASLYAKASQAHAVEESGDLWTIGLGNGFRISFDVAFALPRTLRRILYRGQRPTQLFRGRRVEDR